MLFWLEQFNCGNQRSCRHQLVLEQEKPFVGLACLRTNISMNAPLTVNIFPCFKDFQMTFNHIKNDASKSRTFLIERKLDSNSIETILQSTWVRQTAKSEVEDIQNKRKSCA